MAEEKIIQDGAAERIGTAAHKLRNLLLGVVAVTSVGLLGLYYWSSAQADAVAIQELHGFRKILADKCKQAQFERPASRQLESLYADSSRMQAIVRTQLGSLHQDHVDCEHVLKSLQSVDFPVE